MGRIAREGRFPFVPNEEEKALTRSAMLKLVAPIPWQELHDTEVTTSKNGSVSRRMVAAKNEYSSWYKQRWEAEKHFRQQLQTALDAKSAAAYDEERNCRPRTAGNEDLDNLRQLPAGVNFDQLKVFSHEISMVGRGGAPWEPRNWTRHQLENVLHGHGSQVGLRK